MDVFAGYMYNVVVKNFTFAISSSDEFLVLFRVHVAYDFSDKPW